MSESERRALLFLAIVILLGAVVRVVRAPAEPRAGEASRRALAAQIAAADSAGAADRARGTGRGGGTGRRASGTVTSTRAKRDAPAPPQPPAIVDVDVADSAALETLPGIGPALASRIVANRDSCGPFGSIEGLSRVKGIGPALSKRLTPRVTFSLSPRPSSAVGGCGGASRTGRRGRRPRERS